MQLLQRGCAVWPVEPFKGLSCTKAEPMILLRNAICFMPQLLLLLPPAEYNYSTAAPPSMQNDTITISRHHSNDPAVKLAICHALAQVGNRLPLCCAVLWRVCLSECSICTSGQLATH
jgi:hypothetical protein